MLISLRTIAAAAAAGVALTALSVPAAANDPCLGAHCPIDPPTDESDASSEGGMISVRISGSGTTAGGSTVTVPITQVMKHPPCWMQASWTGAEYAEYVDSGQMNRDNQHYNENMAPRPNYADYADVDGYWWSARCSSGYFDGTIGEFFDYTDEFFASHPAVFVEEGEPDPPFYIPPEILAYFAYEELQLPDPDLEWNPRRSGDTATFVNLDTWVWLDDSPVQLDVTASAAGNSATVTATLDRMTVTAPDAEPAVCDGPGVPWTPTATDGCAITFHRSSANQPGNATTVTVETYWTARWSTGGVDQGGLDPQAITATTAVPVAEVQTVVTG